MNAITVYEGFIGFEERSANLYLELSVRFADNPALRWFWVEMAMEEKQHAGMLQHCRESGLFAGDLPDEQTAPRLDRVFRQLEDRINSAELTLDDAFDIAIRLESSEINAVYSRLTAPIQGPAHVMRRKMELSIAGHCQKLLDAAGRFNASRETQARLERLSLASDGLIHERM